MSNDYGAFYKAFREDTAAQDAERKIIDEKRRADAEMAVRYANLHMPTDIKERAKLWGMSAWAEVLWNNAFQAGYREAMRDRADDPS